MNDKLPDIDDTLGDYIMRHISLMEHGPSNILLAAILFSRYLKEKDECWSSTFRFVINCKSTHYYGILNEREDSVFITP